MTSAEMTSNASGLHLSLSWSSSSPVALSLRLLGAESDRAAEQPLVEALAFGYGRAWAGRRLVTTTVGQRLRYQRHRLERSGEWQTLWLTQRDEMTGLEFTSELCLHDDQQGLRSSTHVQNCGHQDITLQAVSSLVFADFHCTSHSSLDAMTILRGQSDWTAENRWTQSPLREAGLPALTTPGRPFRSRGCIEASSSSSWSTAHELPATVIGDSASGHAWSFQVEHNGGWVWQVGELPEGLYVALFGPTDEHHQWQLRLAPGSTFQTPAAVVALDANSSTLRALTNFRRSSIPVARRGPGFVVFNDYMNTVQGDPTAERLRPLIEAAGAVGADCFVIDAGWYADDDGWWDGVGQWESSRRRFPDGIEPVLDRIRDAGMIPGLWLEPEVVGVNSPVAVKLPDSAFFQRDGVRMVDHGRYHLDFSSREATGYLDEVVDRLVDDLGVGYLKLDYNIRAGAGSNAATDSVGHGLLRHNRAYLSWIASLRERHPRLILENCASGAMRQDFATLSRFDLQSTSDQEDLHAYAPIAAAAPMLVLPEQAANWSYPQPNMSDADITYTLATGVLGRLYLSGWLNELSVGQRAIVEQAVAAHRRLLPQMGDCSPFWPLGLPGWDDEWIVSGPRVDDGDVARAHLTIWCRSQDAGQLRIALPPLPAGRQWNELEPVFPTTSSLTVDLDAGGLDVTHSSTHFEARVVTINALPER